MKFPGFGSKLADNLKSTAGSLLETGTALANKARESEAFQKAGAVTKDTLSQLQQNKLVQDAQQTVNNTVTQLRESDVGRRIETATLTAVANTREKLATLTEQLAYGDDAQWMASVRKTLSDMPEADAVNFLRVLQPEALVKAMYCNETIDIMRKPGNVVDLTLADQAYPGVEKTLRGHVTLDSDSLTIASAIRRLAPAPEALAAQPENNKGMN